MNIRETLHLPPVKQHGVPPDFSGEGQVRRGVTVLMIFNVAWALLPLYWKLGAHIPAIEVVCHRSFWGFLLVLCLLWLQGGLSEVTDILRNRRTLLFIAGGSLAHLCTWTLYVWAVAEGRVIDISLGYYLVPVLNAFSGFLMFGERPRSLQWFAVALAAFGVGGMLLVFGQLPWIGLFFACSAMLFATFRKFAPADAMPGLIIELLVTAPLLWGYMVYLTITGESAFLSHGTSQSLWLIGAGIVTILPQIGYAYALCRVPLTTISLLQYIPPTGNFLLGVFMFNEAFTADKVFGFCFIWAGLTVFTLESIWFRKKAGHATRPEKKEG